MNRKLLFTALLLLLAAGRVLALAEDRSQPISIKAARLEIDQKKGMSTYEGNVEMQQGSMVITATRIVVHHKNNEVSRIEADGTPVKIRQTPAPGKEETRAEARRVEYDLKAATLRLTGRAHIWQDGNEFSGETITYDNQRGMVRASGSGASTGATGSEQKGEPKKERVEVILQPRKETTP
jgi:lipopolysaccharide export system protein LptA